MPKEIRIPVPDGLVTHGGALQEVVLREPTFQDFLEIGEIVSIIRTPDGQIDADMGANINAYMQRCLVQPKDRAGVGIRRFLACLCGEGRCVRFFPRREHEGRSLADVAEDLVFRCGEGRFSAEHVSRMTPSEMLFWHRRAIDHVKRLKDRNG